MFSFHHPAYSCAPHPPATCRGAAQESLGCACCLSLSMGPMGTQGALVCITDITQKARPEAAYQDPRTGLPGTIPPTHY